MNVELYKNSEGALQVARHEGADFVRDARVRQVLTGDDLAYASSRTCRLRVDLVLAPRTLGDKLR